MKIILLGAQGMLGRDLAEVLKDEELTAVDRDDVDITDAVAVQELVRREKPELVLNAAGYTIVDQAESESEAAYRVNETGVRNVARAAREVGAVVVHYSTDYVFPGDREIGYTEDDTPGPAVNVYGASKLAGEQALAESGVPHYLIRTAWLYGKHGKNFVETMLKLANERQELRVIDDQHGSPTFTRDLAAATRELVTGEYEPGVYHLVNEGMATWRTFAEEIFRLADKPMRVIPITTEEYPLPAQRPRYSVLRNMRGPRLRSWREALADYIQSR